jgi:hydrogenase-4 component E
VSGAGYAGLLDVAVGAVLVCALVTVWRRDLAAIVTTLACQGVALAVVVATVALHAHDGALGAVAAVVLILKGVVVPHLLRQVVRIDPGSRESAPLVNVPTSLVAAGVLIVLAYLASGPLSALAHTDATRLVPLATATVLVGFLVMVTRRKAVSQIVGLLLIDNGVALSGFLLTAGVPVLVELGVSLDVLLVVGVLRVLSAALHRRHGAIDLDQLRGLHD